MPEHNEDQSLEALADEAGLRSALVERLPGRSAYPEWIIDVAVTCPACGAYGDGATIFGTRPVTDYITHTHPDSTNTHLRDGLVGECDSCGETITVRLFPG